MHRALGALALLLVVAVPATAGAAPAKAPGILYSLDAKGPTIAKSGKALRLSMPAGTAVTWFTDRPARQAGTTTLRDLAAIWEASGFAEDPPNAALLVTRAGEERTHVVTLRAPRVAHGRVSFALREVPTGAEAGHRHTHDVAAGTYGRARLFIDDAALTPCGSTLRYMKLRPSTSSGTVTFPPFFVQCLLAPGASVAAYPDRTYMSSVWACRASGTSRVYTKLHTDGRFGDTTATACGSQANPQSDADAWLGMTWNAGDCTTTTASQLTVTNIDSAATLRVSLLLDTPSCYEIDVPYMVTSSPEG